MPQQIPQTRQLNTSQADTLTAEFTTLTAKIIATQWHAQKIHGGGFIQLYMVRGVNRWDLVLTILFIQRNFKTKENFVYK